MHLESIKNEVLLNKYNIIELKVRGAQQELTEFFSSIQDLFDVAHDEWDDSLGMLTLTFDKTSEQKLSDIKKATKDYIQYKKTQG